MSGKGIIIRLVDVVLILLFGFVSISEVARQSKIELAKTSEFPVEKLEREEVVFIAITADGRFLVEDESILIKDATSLKNYLLGKKREFRNQKADMRVRIRSNWDTPIKYSLLISEICDNMKVNKSIDVKRIENHS